MRFPPCACKLCPGAFQGSSMRVLHLYSGNLFGGVERMLVTLQRSRALTPEIDQRFGLCFAGRLSRELADADGRVEMLGAARVSRPWTLWQARRRLAQSLRVDRPEIAIAHAWWPCGLFGPVVKAAKIPLVLFVHDVPDAGHWLERWARHSKPDAMIANSDYTLGQSRSLFPHTPARICHPPVLPAKASDRAAVRTELGLTDKQVAIAITCRFERWKGHAALIDALGLLKDQPNWTCLIAGSAQRPQEIAYSDELKATADRLGICNRLKFLEECGDVPRLLSGVDIHCQPNTAGEAFGIAFVEAMNAGLPVVTSDIGGGAEVVGDAGVLVPPNDAPQLAAALRRLILNADLRRKLGDCARVRAESLFSLTASLQRWQAALSDVLQARGAEPLHDGDMVPA